MMWLWSAAACCRFTPRELARGLSAFRQIPASKLAPPSGKSGGKPPHSKTTERRYHQKPMVTITAGSIVDAAHIHEFRDSRNNGLRNGIGLCKNARWTFDQGLWSISDDYRVIVALGHYLEAGPHRTELPESYHGSRLHLAEERTLWPDPIRLAWDRKARFKTV